MHDFKKNLQIKKKHAYLYGQTAAKKKRFVWAKKHKEWRLDQWKSVLWSDESKFEIFGSTCLVFVQRRKGETDGLMVPTAKHGGGGVMVWGCFASDTVGDLFKIEGTLNQHGHPIRFVFRWTIIYFSTGQ